MLEGVTLGEVVKLVVEVLVDLAGSTVLHEKTAEDPLATHPQNLPVIVEIPPSAKTIPHEILSLQDICHPLLDSSIMSSTRPKRSLP